MNKPELSALMKMLAGVVRESMGTMAARLNQRIADIQHKCEEVENRVKEIPAGKDGKDAVVDYEKVGTLINNVIGQAMQTLPVPKDGLPGKDIDPEIVKQTIAAEVEKAVAALPRAKDGKDAEPLNPELIVAECLSRIPVPKDGKDGLSVDHSKVVADVLSQIPVPKDGAPGKDAPPIDLGTVVLKVLEMVPVPKDGKDGLPGPVGKDAQPVDTQAIISAVLAQIPTPTDGLPGKDADPEAVRSLVVAEVSKAVAAIPPAKDGAPGKDAEPIHPDTISLMVVTEVEKAVAKAVALIPKAVDGRDALQLDILPDKPEKSVPRGTFAQYHGGLWRSKRNTAGSFMPDEWDLIVNGIRNVSIVQLENIRTFGIEIELSSGLKQTVGISMPILLYREIFKEGTEYERGDVVTWGGSSWHCNADKTKAKPGNGTNDWRLMVKEGRPGKDGLTGPAGPKGTNGRDGRDLTQMGDGRKW